MKGVIVSEIENTQEAKNKNRKCSEAITELLSMLSIDQKKKFWVASNSIEDYNIFVQDEIFKRLL